MIIGLLAATRVSAQAGPRVTTRIKRALQSLHHRLPRALRKQHHEVAELFGDLVPDAGTRTGLRARTARETMIDHIGRNVPPETMAEIERDDGRPAVDFIDAPPLERFAPEIRPQFQHTLTVLRRMVRTTEAGGDRFLARLLAVHQSKAFARSIDPARYADEVPSPSAFRQSRLMMLAPEAGSDRAIVLRSRQPAAVNLDEVVDAAAERGIKPEEIAILDLRFESERDARWVKKSRRDLSRVNVIRMAMLDHSVPTYEQLREALAVVRDPRYKVVHIHCKGGRGRTGVILAAIRVMIDGWDVDRAIAEAKSLDMSRPLQEFFVREIARDGLRAP